jgi:hypothetical protein
MIVSGGIVYVWSRMDRCVVLAAVVFGISEMPP